nr:jmjC domain-containing protein 4 homolog isoform X1 [Onthophagus taurus]XP_022918982.1 jmjC domain-containing protein 4 homolog isoform X1 [Onthophagus taurus]
MEGKFKLEINLGSENITEDIKIDVVNNDYSYNNFFNRYLINNNPVVIKNISNWDCIKDWINEDGINFSYLEEKYGDSPVMIYNCKIPHYNSQKTECTTLRDYLNSWAKAKDDLLYLKDWHLKNQKPDDNFYRVPIYFASDWLNEYFCECLKDDYRFVYIGPKNTWTPFHQDVFSSYSWSTNIFGQKKWLLFPPGEELKLLDNLGNLPYDLEKVDLKNCKYYEIIQESSEAIFIPSGWYHQVWNLKDSISINHNWVNGCNIKMMWKSLCDNLNNVRKEIEDCKEMENFEDHCQVMLKASFGIDLQGFYEMLSYIAGKRINLLKNNVEIILFDCYSLGENHAIFDLKCILEIFELFIQNGFVRFINNKNDCIFELVENIKVWVN